MNQGSLCLFPQDLWQTYRQKTFYFLLTVLLHKTTADTQPQSLGNNKEWWRLWQTGDCLGRKGAIFTQPQLIFAWKWCQLNIARSFHFFREKLEILDFFQCETSILFISNSFKRFINSSQAITVWAKSNILVGPSSPLASRYVLCSRGITVFLSSSHVLLLSLQKQSQLNGNLEEKQTNYVFMSSKTSSCQILEFPRKVKFGVL